jgi:outer membrane protein TolC
MIGGRYLLFLVFVQSHLFALSLSFESVVQKALEKNLELQIINTDKTITEAKVEEIESLYYPRVGVGVYQQYSDNIDDTQRAGATIGNSYIGNETQYESSTILQMDYPLYDFGVRSSKQEIAKIDHELVDFTLQESAQKLKLKLLEIYSQLLTHQSELEHYQQIKSLKTEIYVQTKRLYEAGQLNKLSISDRAIEVVELERNIEDLKAKVKEQLKKLSFYTKESYQPSITVLPLQIKKSQILEYHNTFTHQSFQLKLQQKEHELDLLNAELFPTVNFFGRYNLYGAKKTSIWVSMYHMRPRNYVVGLSINYNLFEGFKSVASRKKLKAERLKLELQDQEQEELYTQQQQENEAKVESIVTQIEQTQRSMEEQEEKSGMLTRLQAQQEVDGISVLEDRIASIYKQVSLDKSLIEQQSKLMEMEILNEK